MTKKRSGVKVRSRGYSRRGLDVQLPEGKNCPECSGEVHVSTRSVICLNCGLKLSLSEYYDYLEGLDEK